MSASIVLGVGSIGALFLLLLVSILCPCNSAQFQLGSSRNFYDPMMIHSNNNDSEEEEEQNIVIFNRLLHGHSNHDTDSATMMIGQDDENFTKSCVAFDDVSECTFCDFDRFPGGCVTLSCPREFASADDDRGTATRPEECTCVSTYKGQTCQSCSACITSNQRNITGFSMNCANLLEPEERCSEYTCTDHCMSRTASSATSLSSFWILGGNNNKNNSNNMAVVTIMMAGVATMMASML